MPLGRVLHADQVPTPASAARPRRSRDGRRTPDVLAGPIRRPAVTGTGGAGQDCITTAAHYLATEPDAVTRALDVHSPGSDGRCRGCGHEGVRRPCAVASFAGRCLAILSNR